MEKQTARFLAILFFVLHCFTLVSSAAGMTNFHATKSFIKSTFSDVRTDQWYYAEVASAYQYGLVGGQGNGLYHPNGKVTVAEAITFAARISRIYNGKDPVIAPTDATKWYSGYAAYAIEAGIISNLNWKFNENATRETFGLLLSRSLPEAEFPSINNEFSSIPDFGPQETNIDSIMLLFQAGIITGSDEYARFCPETNVTRAEAAAILNRIANPSQRKHFTPLAGEVVFDPDAITLKAGETYCVTCSYLNQYNGSVLSWHTSNSDIAGVSEDGTITAFRNGSATIWTCNAKNVKNSGDFSVTVADKEISTRNTDSILSSVSPSVFTIEGITYTTHQSPMKTSATIVSSSKKESGFFIDADGTAVVNLHLIDNVQKAKVTTSDGKTYTDISLLGTDRVNDIAIIKVNASHSFTPIKLGDSASVKENDAVFYVYPMDKFMVIFENSVYDFTAYAPDGIANSTFIKLTTKPTASTYKETEKLQLINGCPLVNEAGEAIGVCLNDTFFYAKQINSVKTVLKSTSTSLSAHVNTTYGKIPTFGQSIVRIDTATTYPKAYTLSNGSTALIDFSSSAKKYYIRFTAPSAGMLYVALVNRIAEPSSTTPNGSKGMTYYINPNTISNSQVDSAGAVIDTFHSAPCLSYKQMWLPKNGDYVFEIDADKTVTGNYYLHWYFLE